MAKNNFLSSPFDDVGNDRSQFVDIPASAVVVEPAAPAAKAAPSIQRPTSGKQDFDALFEKYGQEYGVPAALLRTIAGKESSFNPNAVGATNANGTTDYGLMQHNSRFHKERGITDWRDPEQSVKAAAALLKANLTLSNGDMRQAVRRYNGSGPRAEAYADDVMARFEGRQPTKTVKTTYSADDFSDTPPAKPFTADDFSDTPPTLDMDDDEPAKPPRDRTWGEVFSDTGVQLAEGANTVIGAIPNLVAPESNVAKFFDENSKSWREKQSEPLLQRMEAANKSIDKAGEDGVIAQITEAASQYFKDPALAARFVTTNLPSMIPGIGAAKMAQAAALARGASAAQAVGTATTAAAGVNAVMNAGGARGEAFDDIKQTLIKQGRSEAEAVDMALRDSRVVAAVGGVAGAVSGKTGLEKVLTQGAAKAAPRSAIVAGGKALAVEGAGEQLEEVAPKVATNVQAGQYDARPATQNVGRTIVETAIGAAPGGIVSGGVEGLGQRQANIAAARAPIEATPNSPSTAAGPLQRAAENAAANPERATVSTPQGQVTGTVTGTSADGQVQIVSDDGEVLTFDLADGQIQITPEAPNTPLSNALEVAADDVPEAAEAEQNQAPALAEQAPAAPETVATAEPDRSPIVDAIAPIEAAPVQAAKETPPAPEPTPTPPPTTDLKAMDEPALRERMRYIADQAKSNNGWSPQLVKARREVEKEVNARATATGMQKFAPETGTLGIPRSEMPQVKSEHHGALVNHLNAKGIEHETKTVDAAALKPTQAEYSPEKVERAKEQGNGDRAIIVSNDGHILDGHHQAMAAAENGEPVKAIVLDAPVKDALSAIKAFPSTTTEGASPKTQKALARIAAGKAWFNDGVKAKDFVTKNGLQDSHQAVKGKGGRWDIVAKDQNVETATETSAPAAVTGGLPDAGRSAAVEAAGVTGATQISEAIDRADRAGLKGKDRREAVLSDLSAAWGMTNDEVADVPQVGAALRKPASKAAKTAAAEDFIEGVKRTAITQNQAMTEEANANDNRTQGQPAGAEEVVGQQASPEAAPASAVQPDAAPAQEVADTSAQPTEDQNASTTNSVAPGEGKGRADAVSDGEPAGDAGGQSAVPGEPAWLAVGIARDIKQAGVGALVGAKVSSHHELAALAQVYRSPLFETARIVFSRGGKVVFETGVSARLPGQTRFWKSDGQIKDLADYIASVKEKSGADSYWLLHNHPSGDPKPSPADIEQTALIAAGAPGFLGHIIINSNKYGLIGKAGTSVVQRQFGEDQILRASQPHAALGQPVKTPAKLAELGKSMQRDGLVTLVGMTGEDNAVRAVMTVEADDFKDNGASVVKRFAQESGSSAVFAYGRREDVDLPATRKLIESATLNNAVFSDGSNAAQTLGIETKRDLTFGTPEFTMEEAGVAEAPNTREPTAKAKKPSKKADAAKPAAEPDAKARLTDAGEELTRNRRNKVSGIAWADVEGMNDTLKIKTVTKANVWAKPNYEQMVADGAPRWQVALLKAIYDKLAAKPETIRAPTDDQMRRYIDTVGRVRDAVMAELERVASDPRLKAAFESDEIKSFASKGDDMIQSAAIMGLRSLFDGKRVMDDVFPKSEGMTNTFDRTAEQGKENNANGLVIGSNKALRALQMDYSTFAKARDILMQGFPAKQEAWEKSYDIKAREARYFVSQKGFSFRPLSSQPKEGFETQELAEEFARELTKRARDEKPLPPSRGLDLAAATRTGPDWRSGKDVTAEDVRSTFGFKGVNLGEYVKSSQKIAQAHLNSAYDGLMDLADLIGVPPNALSLSGTLGIAIGAQGSGRALAHFVPGVNELNITRDSGAGALSHEWGHALDHYFGVQQGEKVAKSKDPFLTEHLSGKPDGVRPEVFQAFKTLLDTMKSKPMTEEQARDWFRGQKAQYERRLKSFLSDIKPKDPAAYAEVSDLLLAGDLGPLNDKNVPANMARYDEITAASRDMATKANVHVVAERLSEMRDEQRFLNTHRPQTPSDYRNASGAMDAGKQKAYWSSNVEMFARAFESYVMDAMQERGQESLYLSGLSDGPMWQAWEKMSGQSSPYPKGDERLAINEAVKALMDAIEVKKTPEGNEALFAEKDQTDTPAFKAWFGDSKVVDAAGRPLVVYHGTAGGDIAEFKYGAEGNTADSNYDLEGLGFFFTPSEQAADGYANNAAEQQGKNVDEYRRTLPAYLSVANPKKYDSVEDVLTAAGDAGGGSRLREALVKAGHDGIVYGEEVFWGPLGEPSLFGLPGDTDAGYHDVVVAFEPTQIKSAIGNNGNFDATDPDIRYATPAGWSNIGADERANLPTLTDKQSLADIGLLQRTLDGQRGLDTLKDQPYRAVRLPDADALDAIGAAFGVRPVGFDIHLGAAQKYDFFSGVTFRGVGSNAIFLSARSTRPHLALLGHETVHQLKTQRPDLYNKLADAVARYVDVTKYEAEFVNSPVARNVKSAEGKQEEFLGEVVSDAFMDPGFWRTLGQESPKLLKQVYATVLRLLQKLAGTPYAKKSAPYLTDFDRVMQIAGEVLAELGEKPALAPKRSLFGFAFAEKAKDQTEVQSGKKWFGDNEVVDDDGDMPGAKYVESDDDAYMRFGQDKSGRIRLQSMASSKTVRGRDMVRWLRQQYGRDIVVDEVTQPAADFWEKMKSEGLISGWSENRFKGSSVPVTQIKSATSPDALFAEKDAPSATTPISLTPPEQGLLRRVQATVQDNMNRVREVQDRIQALTGMPMRQAADYYRAETNRPGRTAARLEDARNDLIQPLMEKLAKSGHTQEQLGELLHAQHAQERNERVAAINPDMPDGGSGMTNAEADAVLTKYAGNVALKKLADEARKIAKMTLEIKHAYGLIDDETLETLRDTYANYVPLKGDGEYGPKIKRAMGHDAREEHILENIARDYGQAVVVGEKNIARQSLLTLVLQNPDSELWSVGVPPRGRYIAGQSYNIYKGKELVGTFQSAAQAQAWVNGRTDSAFDYVIQTERGKFTVEKNGQPSAYFNSHSKAEEYIANIKDPVGKFAITPTGERVKEFVKPLQSNEVPVYVDGRLVRIQIHGDEVLAQQLRPLDQGQMNVILENMRGVNRYLSKIYTGYNPAFILRNAVRDALTGTINITGNQGVVTAAKAWANYPGALTAMGQFAATGKLPGGEMGKMLAEYRDNGGKTGASWMSDLEEQGKTLSRMFDDAYGAGGYLKDGKVGKAALIAGRKMIGGLAHVVEVGNQATENALRLALYTTLRKQGASAGAAAAAAKSVTVDFDRKGSMTGALGAIYLFFNPAVQGTANALKTLVKGDKRAQAWGALGALGLLGLYAATKGMDEDKDRWLGEGWEKRSKTLIIGAGTHTITVPITYEFAPFYAFGVALGESMRGESKLKSAAHIVSSFIDAYFPLQGVYNPESDNHGMDVVHAAMPTILKPGFESSVNRNNFGSQIVPENEFTKNRPDNQKMTRASKGGVFDVTAQGIAKVGELAGAGKYENDMSKVSPETLKHFWRTYTGGLGTFVTDSAGLARLGVEGSASIEAADVPIVKDFYRNNDVRQIRGRFYELTKEARAAAEEFKQAKKAGDGEALDKILAKPEKAELLGLDRLVKSTSKAAAKLRDEEVTINSDQTLSLGQKRAALRELQKSEEELYRGAIQAFR